MAKLRGARERKRAKQGKCEGRKSLAERSPEVIAAAHALNDGRSLRKIAEALAAQGFKTPAKKHYSASAVKRMLGADGSKSRALTHYDAKGRRLLWPEVDAASSPSISQEGEATTKPATKPATRATNTGNPFGLRFGE